MAHQTIRPVTQYTHMIKRCRLIKTVFTCQHFVYLCFKNFLCTVIHMHIFIILYYVLLCTIKFFKVSVVWYIPLI